MGMETIKRNRMFGLSLLLVLLFFPAAVAAEPMFRVTPKLSTSWRSDDNFYKSETNEREVHTYVISPGLDLGFESGNTTVDLGYSLNVTDYDDRDDALAGSSRAEDEDYTGHTVNLLASTQPYTHLGAELGANYMQTRDAAASDPLSNSTDREKFSILDITPTLIYTFGAKFTAKAGYGNQTLDYAKDSLEDTSIDRGIFDLIYNFTPTTSFDIEYQYWTADYSKNSSDYDSNQGKLILRHRFNILSVEAGAGYQNRDFDSAALNDSENAVYHLLLAGDTGKTSFSLQSEWNLNDAGSGDAYYMAHRISADLGRTFMEKIPVSLGGYWQNSDYEHLYGLTGGGDRELRNEDTYDINASVGYIITDWVTVSLKAGYEERDSNHVGRDYEDGYVMGLLEFAYNLGGRN